MDEIKWHKEGRPSAYFATLNGRNVARAWKDAGGAWIGSVVGLGFTVGSRRLMDTKALIAEHVEHMYGDDSEWVLFPVRDLAPGVVLTEATAKDDRTVVAVEVDTEAQTVSAELTSETAESLGFTLDAEFPIDAMCRVRKDSLPTEPEEIEQAGQQSASCGARRAGWERPGPGRHRLPCVLRTEHKGSHRDALMKAWTGEAGIDDEGRNTPAPNEGIPDAPEHHKDVSQIDTPRGVIGMTGESRPTPYGMAATLVEKMLEGRPELASMSGLDLVVAMGIKTREQVDREVREQAEEHARQEAYRERKREREASTVGTVLGGWTILSDAGRDVMGDRLVAARCKCGFERIQKLGYLRYKRPDSCRKCANLSKRAPRSSAAVQAGRLDL